MSSLSRILNKPKRVKDCKGQIYVAHVYSVHMSVCKLHMSICKLHMSACMILKAFVNGSRALKASERVFLTCRQT